MNIIYNNDKLDSNVDDNQKLFDALNYFVMSDDRKVFFKFVTRIKLFYKIYKLPGDIIECGVFKGCGILLWLKLLDLECPHSIKKVIGFDFFDSSFTDKLNGIEKEAMTNVFLRCKDITNDTISKETIEKKIIDCGFTDKKFKLIKGDLSVTSQEYVKDKPGMRISLLYLDVDLEKPTYDALCAFWDHMTPGGIIIFDEYAYHYWTESNAVDIFIKNKNISLNSIEVGSPTLYIIKD